MILGDVFLQAAVVLHNLTDMNHPTLTVFPRKWKHSQTQKEKQLIHRIESGTMDFQSTATAPVIGIPIHKSIHQKNTSHWKQERLSCLLSLTSSPLLSSDLRPSEQKLKPFAVNEVPLQEIMGIQYIAKIGIGTPLQGDIPVIIDTGSSELVLM
jgi:hypothetical protein